MNEETLIIVPEKTPSTEVPAEGQISNSGEVDEEVPVPDGKVLKDSSRGLGHHDGGENEGGKR